MKNLINLYLAIILASISFTFMSCSDDDEIIEPVNDTTSALIGDWGLASQAGALAVGPAAGSADWWFNTDADLSVRSCLFDDVWTFDADGTLSISMGSQTWLEPWQGVDAETCGTPVAPHDGQGSFTFSATESTITLNGQGAFLGLPKAINGSELSADNLVVPDTRTYNILEFNMSSSPKTIKLDMPVAGEGHWTFILVSK